MHRSIVVLSFITLSCSVACSSANKSSTKPGGETDSTLASTTSESVDVKSMLKEARALQEVGSYVKATEMYEWLWHNMVKHDRSMYGVRSSFMASDMGKLIQSYKEARPIFAQIRDDIESEALSEDPDRQTLKDWLVLSHKVLGDSDRVYEWAMKMNSSYEGRVVLNRLMYIVDDLLLEKGELAIVGIHLPSGQRLLDKEIARYQEIQKIDLQLLHEIEKTENKQVDDMIRIATREAAQRSFAKKIAEAHITYLAAERDEDAWILLEGGLKHAQEPLVHNTVLLQVVKANLSEQRHLKLFNRADADLILECHAQTLNQSDS